MRHRKGNKKLGKPTDQRLAMLRSLVRELFLNNRIQTTQTRAKAAQRVAEKIITLGKKGDLASRRKALQCLPDKNVVKTVFDSVAKQNENRNGGFTRVIQLEPRRGDAAPMALLELVR